MAVKKYLNSVLTGKRRYYKKANIYYFPTCMVLRQKRFIPTYVYREDKQKAMNINDFITWFITWFSNTDSFFFQTGTDTTIRLE